MSFTLFYRGQRDILEARPFFYSNPLKLKLEDTEVTLSLKFSTMATLVSIRVCELLVPIDTIGIGDLIGAIFVWVQLLLHSFLKSLTFQHERRSITHLHNIFMYTFLIN